jgi:hypothetical protein
MNIRRAALALLASCGACGSDPVGDPPDGPCATADEIDGLRLNQIQVVGSHNSYRRHTYAPIFAFMQRIASSLPGELHPAGLDYDHLPLAEQLGDYRADRQKLSGPVQAVGARLPHWMSGWAGPGCFAVER